jgi:hypothetical protein
MLKSDHGLFIRRTVVEGKDEYIPIHIATSLLNENLD